MPTPVYKSFSRETHMVMVEKSARDFLLLYHVAYCQHSKFSRLCVSSTERGSVIGCKNKEAFFSLSLSLSLLSPSLPPPLSPYTSPMQTIPAHVWQFNCWPPFLAVAVRHCKESSQEGKKWRRRRRRKGGSELSVSKFCALSCRARVCLDISGCGCVGVWVCGWGKAQMCLCVCVHGNKQTVSCFFLSWSNQLYTHIIQSVLKQYQHFLNGELKLERTRL